MNDNAVWFHHQNLKGKELDRLRNSHKTSLASRSIKTWIHCVWLQSLHFEPSRYTGSQYTEVVAGVPRNICWVNARSEGEREDCPVHISGQGLDSASTSAKAQAWGLNLSSLRALLQPGDLNTTCLHTVCFFMCWLLSVVMRFQWNNDVKDLRSLADSW